ncbi:MAG: type pilus assembly protein PilV [Burkholderiales bacterium]|jgi:type IV pilus assembly protein PilV
MNTRLQTLNKQAGMVLLEGLIAILIFSVGILAIVGMQAAAVRNVGEAKYRSEASLLADSLLGTMWATDRVTASLQTNFNTGGTGYNTWLGHVSTTLPNVASYPPTVVVDDQGIVTITVRWLAPSAGAGSDAHQYIAVAQIR